MTAWLAVAAVPLLALGAIELWLRRGGFADVPLFRLEEPGGYRAAANQHGRFLGRHEWRYDTRGMRFSGELAHLAETTILIGDSVVDGGNRIGQAQTLPALLARETGEAVYPVAARGWALANELAALTAMPRWTEARRLVLVVNSGDFEKLGGMHDPYMFPPHRPPLVLPWLLARQVGRKLIRAPDDPLIPELREQTMKAWRALAARFAGSITIVRYPRKGQDAAGDARFAELQAAAPGSRLIDPSTDPEWGDDCYIDHIHPNAKGLMVLARFIGQNAA